MIGWRIRAARILQRYTQQEVVDQLKVMGISLTKAAISKYELAKSLPPPTLLLKLATVLSVEPGWFLDEHTNRVSWIRFRKHASLGKHDQERVMLLSEAVVERHVRLRQSLGMELPPSLPEPVPVRNEEDAETAALRVREAWGLHDHPIHRMTGLLEDHGCIIVEASAGEGDFHGLAGKADGQIPVVVVSPSPTVDRRRSNLAHELGHLVMDCSSLTEKDEETCAKRFAGAFLVPGEVVLRELGHRRQRIQMPELALLKRRYGLSMQGWARRALDLGVISGSYYTTLCKSFSAMGWRKREPVEYEGSEEPIRLRQMAFRALAEGLISKREMKDLCPDNEEDLERMTHSVGKIPRPTDLIAMQKQERSRVLEEAAEQAAQHYGELPEIEDYDSIAGEGL